MKKKTGNAPPAKTSTQKKEIVDPLLKPIVIPERVKELALGAGIPLDQIVDRANLMQQRLVNMENAVIGMAKGLDKRDEALTPLIELAEEVKKRKQQIAQAQQTMQGQGQPQMMPQSRGSMLERILMGGLFGSGSSNPMMEKFVNTMMEMSMRRALESETFDTVFRNYMIKKMAKEVGEDIVPKSKTETK